MDYSDDASHTFLGLDRVIIVESQWDSHKPPGFWNDMGVSEKWLNYQFGVE